MTQKHLSKFLSLLLRHKPETLGIELDAEGWTDVEEFLVKLQASGEPVTLSDLRQVVAESDKQRFAFNADFSRIRANQGHSLEVDLNLKPIEPPEFLYHGTAERNVAAILAEGIQKRSRQYVHLSGDVETAIKVGSRHGKPVVLRIKSGEMHRSGLAFYRSENGVWLTDFVPATSVAAT